MSKWVYWLIQGLVSRDRMAAQQPRQRYTNYVPPGWILWLWPPLDRIISGWIGIEPLRKDKMGIISVELRRYRGLPMLINEGITIETGDLLIELHLNNAWFLHNRKVLKHSAGEVRWRVSSAFAEDLIYLAGQLADGTWTADVKALHGVTGLYSPARRLGFSVTELPDGFRNRLTRFYLSGLRRVYYFGNNNEYVTQRKRLSLKEIWMSRLALLERYLPQEFRI